MRTLFSFIIVYLLSFNAFAINIDFKRTEWKELDLPNRFPQTFFVSKKITPLYFETGENFSHLSEFLMKLNKNELKVDIEEDDRIKIKKMTTLLLKSINNQGIDIKKGYLINVSVSKLFTCGPCTEQESYVKILNLNNINVINIYLI
ncbi:hypothetical protein [Shewanella kaireitica]|uniref:hypothetical protein n=1 Tax=Shewanella kaireitica TaxID=212021 RepID=UPI00200EED9E|nr:hypothetical protein [Shewanella kaireitica]MCL1092315.1 hypothetical protein [Shewanella kaireitica]